MTIPTRRKQPTEKRTLTFEFAEKLAPGDALTGSPTITASSGITATAGSKSGTTVSTQVSGGTAGNEYTVSCRIGTTQGDVLELDVVVEVRDDAN
jgi:hypothetical protein